ncbi:ribonuclease T2 [Psychrobacter sp. DM4]|uniref:ribonuclease T2 n=1 Tax=Psychrobacter sp. DM4 TaxID=3440637 RepID=UPI003F508438
MIKKPFKSLIASSRYQTFALTHAHPKLTTTPHPNLIADTIKPYHYSYHRMRHIAIGALGFLVVQGVLSMPVQAASVTKSGQRVLMIEMTPALCDLQPTRARMRQCLEGYSLTVSGLNLGYGASCGSVSEPRLTPLQLKVVNRIMPDTTVRNQTWQHYGACGPISANNYFRLITNYAGNLKLPSELTTGNSYTVSKSRFLRQMTRLNSGMRASNIDLICQAGRRQSVLTDIHVCYDGSDFGKCSTPINSCGSNFIISGGN